MPHRFVVTGLLCVTALSACGDDGAIAGGTTEDTGPHTSGGDETTASTGTSITDPDSSGTAADTSETSSARDTTGASGSDTGAIGPEPLELLIFGRQGGVWAYYRWRLMDGEPEEPARLSEVGLMRQALLYPERRVVFYSDTAIWLGSLDGDPEDLVRLDTDPLILDSFYDVDRIADEEAVAVTGYSTARAYRVDFADGIATPPVLVATGISVLASPNYVLSSVVDPLGRFMLFDHDVGKVNVALAPLDPPDPDGLIALTDATAPFSARYRGFMPDGSGLFYETFEDTGAQFDASRELYFVPLEGMEPGAPALVQQIAAPADRFTRWVPHPNSLGVVYSFGQNDVSSELAFRAVEDGELQSPITLASDVQFIDVPEWSPDGEWLTYTTTDGITGERFLLSLADVLAGTVPTPLTPVTHLGIDGPNRLRFSVDSEFLYFEHDGGGDLEIARVALTPAGWTDWVDLVTATPGVAPWDIEDLTADGNLLLYGARIDEVVTQFLLDVSGRAPGAPITVSAPPPGYRYATGGRISAGQEYVVYTEADFGGWSPLMLVDLETPGAATEIIEHVDEWQFVP